MRLLPRPPQCLRAAALLALASAMAACGTLNSGQAVVEDRMNVPAPTALPAPPAPLPPSPPIVVPAPAPAPDVGAVPRVERIAKGAPNARYEVAGKTYEPQSDDAPLAHAGIASWYGKPFHGRATANGEVYDMHAMTAAHKTMPLPSYARVRNPANGRELIVRINDRGPFKPGRVIDLSYAAAQRLGIAGLAHVEVTRLTHAAIRSGAWKRPQPAALEASLLAAVAP